MQRQLRHSGNAIFRPRSSGVGNSGMHGSRTMSSRTISPLWRTRAMVKQVRIRKAIRGAQELVSRLRASNRRAEQSGARRVPEKEYRALERELARKLLRASA